MGHWRQRFTEGGLLTPDGKPAKCVSDMEARAKAQGVKDPVHIGVNVLLTNCTRWDSILVLVQVPQLYNLVVGNVHGPMAAP